MSEQKQDVLEELNHSRSFGEVLRTELRTLLPELPLPPFDPTPPKTVEELEAKEEELQQHTYAALDRHGTELAALCLSGGGIRSATFALGVLQGLARFGMLENFHYLSTVSGGGYIGSWLSTWRSLHSDKAVFAGLNAAEREGSDRPQISGIRADSNYLTPMLGLLSADTWTLMTLYVRNLLLNWLLFFPFFTGCLLIPYWCATLLRLSQHETPWPAWPWYGAACVLLTLSLTFGIFGRFRMREEWMTRQRFLLLVVAPLVASATCFTAAAEFDGASRSSATLQCLDVGLLLWGTVIGMTIYAISWAIGRAAAGRTTLRVLWWDVVCWIVAGAAVGTLISVAVQWITRNSDHPQAIVVLGLSGIVLAYLAGDILYAGLASFSPRGDIDREWLARAAGWLAAVAVGWGVISAIVLYSPEVLQGSWARLFAGGVGGLSGLVTLLLGSSSLTAATRAATVLKNVKWSRIAALAAVIFAVLLAALASLAGQELARSWSSDPEHPSIWIDSALIVLLVGAAFLISLPVNVNRFSLHALYRNRLERAFIGSARAQERKPDPFTGFDPDDNPRMAEVVPRTGENRLFHVINTTLNVVSSNNPAWQERKAESFVITRQFSGNPVVRFQPTATYGDKYGGISLGTATAISGAAVSPNQGYNSSPLIGFLLMLFNVRLGWWLGNPRTGTFRREGPVWGIVPALKELAGATTDQGNWIYLSDGGHFENLGLYEMVRRRCRFIVVSDAGCDPKATFEDLGNAVRKIYIDFGVSINFEQLTIEARKTPPVPGVSCAIGTIKYPNSDQPGWLLYIKPGYHGTERADIRSYASFHEEFPHESTTDQWFTESQLEAYRALGAQTMELICNGGAQVKPGSTMSPLTLAGFKTAVGHYFDKFATVSRTAP
jgi:Patatin-like phospholipase